MEYPESTAFGFQQAKMLGSKPIFVPISREKAEEKSSLNLVNVSIRNVRGKKQCLVVYHAGMMRNVENRANRSTQKLVLLHLCKTNILILLY